MQSNTPSPLQVEECRQIIHEADRRSPRHGFTAYLIAHTGLTSSEAAHFQPHWLDTTDRKIHVPDEEGGWRPKNHNRIRRIPLSTGTTEQLAQYIDILPDDAFGVTPGAIYKRIDAAAYAAGVNSASPHRLRKTLGRQLQNLGVPHLLVLDILGISKPARLSRHQPRDLDPNSFAPIYGELDLTHTPEIKGSSFEP